MLPGIDLRLQNVIKALREVVLPAIPPEQRLARDQAMLAIGHLGLFANQWRHAARFEHGSLVNMMTLGHMLLDDPAIDIGEPSRAALAAAMARAEASAPSDLTAVEQVTAELGALVDDVILHAGRPGALPPRVIEAVLAYGQVQARRERIWFAGTKLDPDVEELDSIETMLAAESAGVKRSG